MVLKQMFRFEMLLVPLETQFAEVSANSPKAVTGWKRQHWLTYAVCAPRKLCAHPWLPLVPVHVDVEYFIQGWSSLIKKTFCRSLKKMANLWVDTNVVDMCFTSAHLLKYGVVIAQIQMTPAAMFAINVRQVKMPTSWLMIGRVQSLRNRCQLFEISVTLWAFS